jgi:predicted molibdopterin-dependent oxidoreductase YjgC
VDRGRLENVRGPSSNGKGATWEQALTATADVLVKLKTEQQGKRIGVIASAQLTNEELFLIREVFRKGLGAQVSAAVPDRPGDSDDFLIKADKNPNTRGAMLLGLAGAGATEAGAILDQALAGKLDVLWVFGHDLTELFPSKKVAELSERVKLLVYSGTNGNPTAQMAHWALPTAAYVEKDGTFVNCNGRVQRIGRAFPPFKDSREDWRILLELAKKLGLPEPGTGPEKIFDVLAATEKTFESLSYKRIGAQGEWLSMAKPEAKVEAV